MCGIAGLVTRGDRQSWVVADVVADMASALSHRGPDDGGVWADETGSVALAHRRLSILDLSVAGHQPMASPHGRFVVVFNGEIYNHLDLRRTLKSEGWSEPWRGHSDTETFLAACETWGLEHTLLKSVGMFALALWDKETGSLLLARDRLGEKPLYYGWREGVFLFGSELKALRCFPGGLGALDRGAIALFIKHAFIPAPYSIYASIRKLPPGCWLEFTPACRPESWPEPHQYWSVTACAGAGVRYEDETIALDDLERRLTRAVVRQQISDVPLGAFLSGGIDSSTVVALMQANASYRVKTFSIGFENARYNEAEYARAVAMHLGTDHTEHYVTAAEALAVIPLLPTLYDEPFADSSQIPTHLVSQLARQHVTVCLSGDGGDELFGGYNHYARGQRLWRAFQAWPLGLRRALASALRATHGECIGRLGDMAALLLPEQRRLENAGHKLHRFIALLDSTNADDLYGRLVSPWRQPERFVVNPEMPKTWTDAQADGVTGLDTFQRMMLLDTLGYLPDDILTKVDRAAMGIGLETRIPLLDHEIVEFAWQLPLTMKYRAGQGKWLLRQLLYRHVPREMVDRPKMGFSVPLAQWLRGPLRDWAEELLEPQRIINDGYLNAVEVRRAWAEHLSGKRDWEYGLWNVLMFQAWREAGI